jgi:protein gp37
MERADWHVFQVLTKRSSLMRRYINHRYQNAPSPNHIWLGVSVEDAARVSRIKHLQETNATVRFLSVEPMIGPIGRVNLQGIHWVIAGGESGPRARHMEEEWVCELRNQCRASGVAFFFKQWGGKTPKSGGRKLQGQEWNEFPKLGRRKRSFPVSSPTHR